MSFKKSRVIASLEEEVSSRYKQPRARLRSKQYPNHTSIKKARDSLELSTNLSLSKGMKPLASHH